jgi:hypothetical protein
MVFEIVSGFATAQGGENLTDRWTDSAGSDRAGTLKNVGDAFDVAQAGVLPLIDQSLLP